MKGRSRQGAGIKSGFGSSWVLRRDFVLTRCFRGVKGGGEEKPEEKYFKHTPDAGTDQG